MRLVKLPSGFYLNLEYVISVSETAEGEYGAYGYRVMVDLPVRGRKNEIETPYFLYFYDVDADALQKYLDDVVIRAPE